MTSRVKHIKTINFFVIFIFTSRNGKNFHFLSYLARLSNRRAWMSILVDSLRPPRHVHGSCVMKMDTSPFSSPLCRVSSIFTSFAIGVTAGGCAILPVDLPLGHLAIEKKCCGNDWRRSSARLCLGSKCLDAWCIVPPNLAVSANKARYLTSLNMTLVWQIAGLMRCRLMTQFQIWGDCCLKFLWLVCHDQVYWTWLMQLLRNDKILKILLDGSVRMCAKFGRAVLLETLMC